MASSWLWSSWMRLGHVSLEADATFPAYAPRLYLRPYRRCAEQFAGSLVWNYTCVYMHMYMRVHMCGHHPSQTQVKSQLCL